jgi:hypothetical protein
MHQSPKPVLEDKEVAGTKPVALELFDAGHQSGLVEHGHTGVAASNQEPFCVVKYGLPAAQNFATPMQGLPSGVVAADICPLRPDSRHRRWIGVGKGIVEVEIRFKDGTLDSQHPAMLIRLAWGGVIFLCWDVAVSFVHSSCLGS